MTEKELISKIQELKKIKPEKDWVVRTKTQILGPENFSFFPYFKLVFASLIFIFVIFGLFGFAQNSLPGDVLYPVKKITEKGREIFLPPQKKPVFQLKLANEKLRDLTKVSPKNLTPTINEFEANISEAAKNLTKLESTNSNPIVIKEVVKETEKLKANKEKIESSLGIKIDQSTQEIDQALGKIVKNLINDLEKRSLSLEKAKVLEKMKKLYQAKKYSEALELYLVNQ